jgi:glucose-specific phosphotransferase system IIA component
MFGFFKKRGTEIVAVANGRVIPMEQVNDTAFSEKLLGDGVAIIPDGDIVVAPCSGKISMIADTGHAFGMECDNGMELLVHIGIDTVSLNGKGFTVKTKADTHVKAGTPIVSFDRNVMDESGLDMVIPIIVLDNKGLNLEMHYPQTAKAGETIVMECR